MNEIILGKFFIFFSKFEYALVRSGFCRQGRKVNRDSLLVSVEADWKEFIEMVPEGFFQVIRDDTAYAEIFQRGGPKIWACYDRDAPDFHDDVQITNTSTLLYACKHIRNNLIHGEKLQRDQTQVERNQSLLSCAQGILIEAMRRVSTDFGSSLWECFQSIPISHE